MKHTLRNRQGMPIDAVTWDKLRSQRTYFVVAHDFVVPTRMEVLTIWEGVPTPGAMFCTGVRVNDGWYVTVKECDTEAMALDTHARFVELYWRLAYVELHPLAVV